MITDSITSAAASISKEFGKKKRVRIQSQFLFLFSKFVLFCFVLFLVLFSSVCFCSSQSVCVVCPLLFDVICLFSVVFRRTGQQN